MVKDSHRQRCYLSEDRRNIMNKRKVLNIIIFLIVLITWLRMVFAPSDVLLTVKGLASLKYFTVLSNLFEGIACVIWLFNGNEKIKYAA